jgi:Asp-tRNA(Asn)/Glu-tRNA(Gln) amidotransferase B subunit
MVVEKSNDPKKACSYLTTVILALAKEENISDISSIKVSPEELAEVIKMVNADELSSTNAKVVIEELFKN